MRFAFRSLCRAPGLAIAVIGTLAAAVAFTIASIAASSAVREEAAAAAASPAAEQPTAA